MADVRIRHLALRITRKGGWSWGADPKRWRDAATRALPGLLAEELGELFAGSGVQRVGGRLRVHVRLRRDEAEALLRLGDRRIDPRRDTSTRQALGTAPIRAAIRAGLARGVAALEPTQVVVAPAKREAARELDAHANEETDEADANAATSTGGQGATLVRLLQRWRAQGTLLPALESAAPDVVRRWHDGILARTVVEIDGDDPTLVRLERIARAIERGLAVEASPLVRRLLLALHLAEHGAIATTDPRVAACLDRVVPLGDASPPCAAVIVRPPAREHRPPPIVDDLHVDVAQTVDQVLPFVALGVLSRLGWLAHAMTLVDGANDRRAATAWATAFAYKLAAPPHRGWHRDPRDRALAAGFVARAQPIDEPELVELAAALAGRVGVLDDALRETLSEGRGPDDACCVAPARSGGRLGWLCAELHGAFPIAWAPDIATLVAALPRELPLLVPGPAADPATLATLDRAGLCFVTDAPPVRHEPWQRVDDPRARLWTNRAAADPVVLAARFASLVETDAAARAVASWDALAERPAVVRADDPALDTSLGLAVGVALATIAWLLWRKREPTDGLLALERFGDLGGRVRIDDDAVRVGLPRGRRRDDLERAGLLRPIRGVPWLPHATLEFTTA